MELKTQLLVVNVVFFLYDGWQCVYTNIISGKQEAEKQLFCVVVRYEATFDCLIPCCVTHNDNNMPYKVVK